MKKLLFSITKNDLEITSCRGSGPGGQHRNKTDSAVKILHKESGCIGESQSERSQHQNKKIAFKRLIENPKFKLWINKRVFEINQNKTIDQVVNEKLCSDNLLFEIVENNEWIITNKFGKWDEYKE